MFHLLCNIPKTNKKLWKKLKKRAKKLKKLITKLSPRKLKKLVRKPEKYYFVLSKKKKHFDTYFLKKDYDILTYEESEIRIIYILITTCVVMAMICLIFISFAFIRFRAPQVKIVQPYTPNIKNEIGEHYFTNCVIVRVTRGRYNPILSPSHRVLE